MPDAFTLHTPEYRLTSSSRSRARVVGDPHEAAAELRRAVDSGVRSPMVVGALAFRAGEPSPLMVAQTVRTGPAPVPHRPQQRSRPGLLRGREHPAAADYVRLVERLVARIADTELEKAVLARTLLLDFDAPLDPVRVLGDLVAANPGAWNFSLPLLPTPDGAPAAVLVGASPELLVSRRGRTVRSHPLAGSVPRHCDPGTDRERAAALSGSAKDLGEHAFVVADIAERLRPLCSSLEVPASPSLVATPTMWHLGTSVTGILKDPAPTALELADTLHPTPAVCGTPTGAAARVLSRLEPFDRGAYTGTVGWCDPEGDGDWAVVLRCAELSGARARLFAGAGIVADSVPSAELTETGAKFRTVLDALGVGVSADAVPVPTMYGETT
ncbi:isochorismate synthase MenF [Nocardiopsis sp. CNT312]|uniref:isochorismate synthase n=1 Tax=Nocardiopsis sp. CNT312 TaxID=1137268 RepID=UPI0004B4A625|nr:isochorismate synthase [Nocardiopsis sp. CNT312]